MECEVVDIIYNREGTSMIFEGANTIKKVEILNVQKFIVEAQLDRCDNKIRLLMPFRY